MVAGGGGGATEGEAAVLVDSYPGSRRGPAVCNTTVLVGP